MAKFHNVVWFRTSCSLVLGYQRFGRTFGLNLYTPSDDGGRMLNLNLDTQLSDYRCHNPGDFSLKAHTISKCIRRQCDRIAGDYVTDVMPPDARSLLRGVTFATVGTVWR